MDEPLPTARSEANASPASEHEASPAPARSLPPDRFQGFEEAVDRIPSATTCSILAAAGGYLDAFTYVGHGHVFANAMTGNVVLLGINCISGDWRTGLRHLPPIMAFAVGIAAAKAIELWAVQRRIRFRYLSVLALEIAILALLSVLPAAADFLITTSIAFAASVQVETFRQVHGRSYNSTFTTGNLRTLSEGIFDWFTGARTPQTVTLIYDFALICAAFLAGATLGGFATPLARNHGMLNRALWIDIALLLAVVARVWPRRKAVAALTENGIRAA
jgi:uncharacterized membrane protein YoaK (UPF0700 family)